MHVDPILSEVRVVWSVEREVPERVVDRRSPNVAHSRVEVLPSLRLIFSKRQSFLSSDVIPFLGVLFLHAVALEQAKRRFSTLNFPSNIVTHDRQRKEPSRFESIVERSNLNGNDEEFSSKRRLEYAPLYFSCHLASSTCK